MPVPDIAAVNLRKRIAVTDTDVICQITNMFDSQGNETDEPSEATSAVAKQDDVTWYAIDLSLFVGAVN